MVADLSLISPHQLLYKGLWIKIKDRTVSHQQRDTTTFKYLVVIDIVSKKKKKKKPFKYIERDMPKNSIHLGFKLMKENLI